MRQSIILSDKQELILLHEAEKSNLIKPLFEEEMKSEIDFIIANNRINNYLESQVTERNNLFRLLLLYDEIILPSTNPIYDYDNLINTGNFSLYSVEDFLKSNQTNQEYNQHYAKHLKHAIIPVLEKQLKSYFKLGQPNGGFNTFISDLYDCMLLNKKLSNEYNDFIKRNIYFLNFKNKAYNKERVFRDIDLILNNLYETLCWELQISNDKNAVIYNSEFNLSAIGYDCYAECNDYSKDIQTQMEAYAILKVECGKIIGTLPKVENIQEVLRLKEKRHNDIHNLKQELSRIEYEIRNGSTETAIKKAAFDIEKASKALSKNTVTRKIEKFTNIFSIPLTMAALFAEQPEIAIGSSVLSVVSKTSCLIGDYIKDKNQWFQVII